MNGMRKRRTAGALFFAAGMVLEIASTVLSLIGSIPAFQFWVQFTVGLVLLIAGLALIVMDLIEAFLARSSTALVDGLQAG